MPVYGLGEFNPEIAASAYVAPGAVVIGNVVLGDEVTVWFGATLRGDNEPIRIGARSNVQDGAIMHTDPGFPLSVGHGVTVGHQAALHGCSVGDGALIGIRAVILNGAVIGPRCLVGAGAVVTERKVFAERSLILGAPARVVRLLDDVEVAALSANAAVYVQRGTQYRDQLRLIRGDT
jgi:carbonic anhydrase/acetyltransferase-like protein (isoleucine patch superfamily)